MVDIRILAEGQADSVEAQVAHAVAAERAGFTGWFRSEHYLMGDPGFLGTDALLTLAAVAGRTDATRLGTLVSPATFRAPGPLAIQVAQLDHMSGGRMEFGLGAGWYGPEHAAFGIDFGRSAAERFDRLHEQLEIISRLWTAPPGSRVSFDGLHYRLDGAPPIPTAQQPRVPLIVGGQGPRRTPALAARFADEFNALRQTPDALTAVFARVRRACDDFGRDPDGLVYSAAVMVCCGRSAGEIEQRVVASRQPQHKLTSTGAVGTPTQVIRRLEEFVASGATRLYLRLTDLRDLDHLELLGAGVASAFTG